MPRVVQDKDKQKARMEMRITEQDRDDFDEAAKLAGSNNASEWGRALMRREARTLIDAAKKKKR